MFKRYNIVLLFLLNLLGSCDGCKSSSCGMSKNETIDYNFNYIGLVVDSNYIGNVEVQYFNIDSNKIVSEFVKPPCIVGGYKTKLNIIIYYPCPQGGTSTFGYDPIYDIEKNNYLKIINNTNKRVEYFIYGGENMLKTVSIEEFKNQYINTYNNASNWLQEIQTKNFKGNIAVFTPIIFYYNTPIYYMLNKDKIKKEKVAFFTAKTNDYLNNEKELINLFSDTALNYCGGLLINNNYSINEILQLYKKDISNYNIFRFNASYNISFNTNNLNNKLIYSGLDNYVGTILPNDSLTNNNKKLNGIYPFIYFSGYNLNSLKN